MASKFFAGVVKWLCIPAIMVAIGFYALGPKIGNNTYVTSKIEPVREAVEDSTAAAQNSTEPEPPKGKYSDLKIDVDFTKDDNKKPDSNSEKPKKTSYFSPDAGKKYDEIPEQKLPETPTDTAQPATEHENGQTGW